MYTGRTVAQAKALDIEHPLKLALSLAFKPSEYHIALLNAFEAESGPIHLKEEDDGFTSGWLAFCALWWLLNKPHSRVSVISGDERAGKHFMSLMKSLTGRFDPKLRKMSDWKAWNHLEMASTQGYEARFLGNLPEYFAREWGEFDLFVVLGAGNSDPQFVETVKAIEAATEGQGTKLAYLW